LCWQTVEQQFNPALAIASSVGGNIMKTHIINILAILILTSCGSNNSSKVDNEKKEDTSNLNVSKTQILDIRAFGQGIIDGKIRPSDNNETFTCLDSINNPNPSTRKFFFEVYRIIARNADGALSEVIGEYLKPYLQTFTKEALDNFKKLDKKEKDIFIDNLAYEFSMSDNDFKSEIDSYFTDISKTCKDCKTYDKSLQFIRKGIMESAKKMKE
jgi:hypothetical protein